MPSPRTLSSKSVTSAATSISASAPRSRPVISQSIHTSLSLTTGHPTDHRRRRSQASTQAHLLPGFGDVKDWFGLVARLVTGGVWIVAGALKLPDPADSVRAVRAYDLLPEAVVPAVGHLLPVVEVVIGLCLVARRPRARHVAWCRRCCSSRSSSASPAPGRAGCRSTAAASAAGARSPTRRRSTPARSPATSACWRCPRGSSSGHARGWRSTPSCSRPPRPTTTPTPIRDHEEGSLDGAEEDARTGPLRRRPPRGQAGAAPGPHRARPRAGRGAPQGRQAQASSSPASASSPACWCSSSAATSSITSLGSDKPDTAPSGASGSYGLVIGDADAPKSGRGLRGLPLPVLRPAREDGARPARRRRRGRRRQGRVPPAALPRADRRLLAALGQRLRGRPRRLRPEVAKKFHDLLFDNQPSEERPVPRATTTSSTSPSRRARPRPTYARASRTWRSRAGSTRPARRRPRPASTRPRRCSSTARRSTGERPSIADIAAADGGLTPVLTRLPGVSLQTFIAGLPKAELHVHHVGSASPRIVSELAARHPDAGVPSDLDGLKEFFTFRDFAHFIDVYLAVVDLIRTPEDIRLLTYEVAREMAEGQNLRYAELTCTPYTSVRARHRDRGLHRGDRGRPGRRRARLRAGAALDLRHPGRVRDPGRRRDPGVRPRAPHRRAGRLRPRRAGDRRAAGAVPGRTSTAARAAGLHSVPHAGETTGPETIWESVRLLGAERIGHGCSAAQDPELLAHLAETGIALEVCPTSNIATRAVDRIEDHPLRAFVDAGVTVTINSDDPPMFATTLNHDYEVAAGPARPRRGRRRRPGPRRGRRVVRPGRREGPDRAEIDAYAGRRTACPGRTRRRPENSHPLRGLVAPVTSGIELGCWKDFGPEDTETPATHTCRGFTYFGLRARVRREMCSAPQPHTWRGLTTS